MSLSDISLSDIGRLMTALHAIRYREFAEVLRRTIGATDDYSRGVYGNFTGGPIGWCLNRNPIRQGEELFALAREKVRIADETGRVIGCPGEGMCHDGARRCESCGEAAMGYCHMRETCPEHRFLSDAELDAATLRMATSEGRGVRHPQLVERLARDVWFMTQARGGSTKERAAASIQRLVASKELIVVPGWNEARAYVAVPLEVLAPGEHSAECARNWDESAAHDPLVCSWEEPAVAADVDDDGE